MHFTDAETVSPGMAVHVSLLFVSVDWNVFVIDRALYVAASQVISILPSGTHHGATLKPR